MSLVRPRAVIDIDGRKLTSAEAALIQVRVRLGFTGAHDGAELMFWRDSKFARVQAGAALRIALGHAGEEEPVWSGVVAAVAPDVAALAIDGVAATVALSRARLSQSFLDQSVADIVSALAGQAAVNVDEVSGDLTLPAYAIDDRRSLWAHILDLASLVGADVGSSADGALRFVPVRTGSADVTLRFGADVLSWSGGAQSTLAAPVFAAHGAGSEAGAAQWHWPLRSPTSGSIVQGALRTRDAAEAMSSAFEARAARSAVSAQLRVVGRPALRPGDLIEVQDLPADLRILRATTVEHVLDTRNGFTTTIGCEGAS